MTKPGGESFLPRVEYGDIAQILFEDIVDKSHEDRYISFAQSNPEIIREITKRAYIDASNYSGGSAESVNDIRKMIIDSVTFTLSALEAAARRRAIDDVVDADQQH